MVDMALGKVSTAEEGWRMVPDAAGKPARSPWHVIAAARRADAWSGSRPRPGGPTRSASMRRAGSACRSSAIRFTAGAGGTGRTMLLHSAQLTDPARKKPPIVAAAPLPPNWGDWREAGLRQRPSRSRSMRPEDVDIPEERAERALPRRVGAGRAERQQGRDRGASCASTCSRLGSTRRPTRN